MLRESFFISCVLLLVNISPSNTQEHPDGHMRLAGGPSPYEGRVEVYHNGQWGTVCDDDWGIYDAHVVCQYLNFSGAVSAVEGAAYGEGSGPIWLDDVRCRGDESDLSLCESAGWGVENCNHGEDAGVVCMPVVDPWSNSSLENPTHHAISHSTLLPDLLGALFDSGRDCDVQIAVLVDGEPAGSVCAHRIVLSMDDESSVLKGSLNGLEVSVSVNCSQYVNSFVRYLYTRQINITSSSLQCIDGMASSWGLKRLQEEVGRLYSWVLPQDSTFQTQLSLYEYSVRTSNRAMQNACLRYLAWNFQDLVLSAAWRTQGVPLATLEALLSRSDLVVPSESFVLGALESWEVGASGGASLLSEDHEDRYGLLKHIRFPMIPARDLYGLRDPRYGPGRTLGFLFGALRFGPLPTDLLGDQQSTAFTPRIYTGEPWSYTFDSQEAEDYRRRKFFFRNHTRHETLDGSFSTPVYGDVWWSTELSFQKKDCTTGHECGVAAKLVPSDNCSAGSDASSSPAVGREPAVKRTVAYGNKLVLTCAGRYVFHVEEFNSKGQAVVPDIRRTAYPCNSRSHLYQVVVRPQYTPQQTQGDQE